ncbi:carboxynorspermidine decarboxylase [Marinomonas agarivorans]|nr:carboxynorspermidine decarboxylase [Marinomonas agarivorans]
MHFTDFSKLDLSRLPSPCFVVDEVAVERNLRILHEVEQKSGAKILHALKAFSLWDLAPLTQTYLSGTCASGLHEARLGKEHYGGEVHVFSAAFTDRDFAELLTFADHIVFNSCSQLLRYADACREAQQKRPELSFGLRINPEHSEGDVPIYDPCAAGSRLGVTRSQLDQHLVDDDFQQAFALLSGLHFHTLCEQDFLPLQRTLAAVEAKFGDLIGTMSWVNFGGGHHISHPDYQVNDLIAGITAFAEKYQIQVYLEPGEAVAIGTGVLVSEVLDIGFNELPQAILDTSATCHMPDTLEMPYKADISTAVPPNETSYNYRLGGLTCLAGDIIGDYSFAEPLSVGDRLVFEDMAHYTMVKTSTFNGTKLPAIAVWNSNTDALRVVREFDYNDFKTRLS